MSADGVGRGFEDWGDGVEESGVREEDVDLGDGVFGFELLGGLEGIRVGDGVDLDDDEFAVGSDGEGAKGFGGRGNVADGGDNGSVGTEDEGGEQGFADASVGARDEIGES